METQEIYSVLKSGSQNKIKSLIETAPENSMKDFVLGMADSQNLAHLIIAFTNMIMEYCYGSNPEYGVCLAEAAHKIALEIYNEQTNHGGLQKTTLSNIATQHLNALNQLGRSEEVLAAAENYIPIYKNMNEMENYPSLVIAKADALLNLNKIDDSKEILANLDCTKNPGAHIAKNQLLKRIEKWQADMTNTEVHVNSTKIQETILDALQNTDTSVLGDDQNLLSQFMNVLGDKNQRNLDPTKIDDYERMLTILDQGEAMLTKGSTEDSELTMRKKCRTASAIFHPNASTAPDKHTIQNSLTIMNEVYSWAKPNNSKELLNDAIWGRYLCHSRMDRNSEAADALIELRGNLEAQRIGIIDPVKRGGAFSTYPEIFNVLCERLQKSGRYFELLEAIEASKGRAIADLLTLKLNKPVSDVDVYGAVSNLSSLTQQHQFHYLSFYVDLFGGTATIYMVMMCKDGSVYGCNPVLMDEKQLNTVFTHLDPKSWDKPGNRGKKTPNASLLLEPLTTLINDLFTKNILNKDDHICYTADEQLYNLPLHYLPFDGGLLIDSFSFSRIHNVLQLQYILETVPGKPEKATVFIVPTIQDTKSKNWSEFDKNINRPAQYLQNLLETEQLSNKQVTLDALIDLPLNDAVLHFSTHGVTEIGSKNPFTSSGLVFSDGKKLPNKDEIANGDLSCVLTPKKLFNNNIILNNSHVSLMACVSGLSREGIGGDALGLDWAFVNAGARSILSSHWNISARRAADFFEQFYHNWLVENQSKARAFQNTIRNLQLNDSNVDIHQYSAFSLSGDWR